ncbi:MAG: LLM class flavin-dependent oxidoreductase [Chromatiales bacterium]|jgi:5,10-methylenetetrahydromethanopterin reductase|nr:LLM class flavin-dependent oxidoreductase [Chromatiales bacterium]
MHIHFIFEPDSPRRLGDLGRLAEELGFDAVWLPNILSARDPFLAFSWLARESQRVRMGPVAISPFELHPLKIANSLLTLNELSGGRANIVIGGGGGTVIGMGLKPDRRSVHPHMVAGVRECLEFLRAIRPDEAVTFTGRHWHIEAYRPDWATQPPPRLYVAASRPRMLRLAGELGDGVMLSDIALPALPATLATLREGLALRATPPPEFPVNNLLAWHVKRDRTAAYAEARRKLWVRGIWERARIAPYLAPADCDRIEQNLPALAAAYHRGSDPGDVVGTAVMDALVDGLTLTGGLEDIDRIVGELRAMRDAGVTELGLRLYGEPDEAIRLVAERVRPALA